jgi:enoyl-CoA hydratase/carnithine racemase
MTTPLVLVERHNRIAMVTLNRPEARNAINQEITAELSAVFDRHEADDDVWVHVITGAEDKCFCAGADLKEVAEHTAAGTGGRRATQAGFAGITTRNFLKPIIAAVNGAALGGGTEICLACDLVVADEHAEFGLPEVRRGLFAGAMGLQRLPRRIPPAIAAEIILTGRPIGADRAYSLGLVNKVVRKGECVAAAIELAEQICLGAPLAVRYSKAVARASISMGEDGPAETLASMRRAIYTSEDFREGPRAFIEHRAPRWQGR